MGGLMEFLEVMNALFALQKVFPDMRWNVEDEFVPKLNVVIYITPEIAKALNDARRMFEPA